VDVTANGNVITIDGMQTYADGAPSECQMVTELYAELNGYWTKYEAQSSIPGLPTIPFVTATGGLKMEQSGNSIYAELFFPTTFDAALYNLQ
jgi:hypothetical protein